MDMGIIRQKSISICGKKQATEAVLKSKASSHRPVFDNESRVKRCQKQSQKKKKRKAAETDGATGNRKENENEINHHRGARMLALKKKKQNHKQITKAFYTTLLEVYRTPSAPKTRSCSLLDFETSWENPPT